MRSRAFDRRLRYAWQEATPIPNPPGVTGDEVRYHEPTDTYIVRKEGELTTVLRADLGESASGCGPRSPERRR